MIFRDMTISRRLIIGFSSIIALSMLLMVVSIIEVNAIRERLFVIQNVNSVEQRQTINFRGSVHDRSILLRDVVLVETEAEVAEAIAEIDKLAEDYRVSAVRLDELMAMSDDAIAAEILSRIKKTEIETTPLIDEAIRLHAAGDDDGAHAVIMGQARFLFIRWLSEINEFIDLKEAQNQALAAEVNDIADGFTAIMVGFLLITLSVSAFFAWLNIQLARPLAPLADVVAQIADKNFEIETPKVDTRCEVGRIADAVALLRDNGAESAAQEAQVRQEQERRLASAALMADSIDRFERAALAISDRLDGSAGELRRTAGALGGVIDQASTQSGSVAAAAQQASATVRTVADHAQGVASSLIAISADVNATAQTSQKCAEAAADSRRTLDELQSAVGEIDAVISAINDVAEQTNLLSLNATIEAARAGDAGKGFAVVAGEVKSLAGQTHKMTDEINQKISRIQASTATTIQSVNAIIQQISEVDQRTGDVAKAIAEQNEATAAISRNVDEASNGVEDVTRNIDQIRAVATHGAESTENLHAASSTLSEDAAELNKAVQAFLSDVRTAAAA